MWISRKEWIDHVGAGFKVAQNCIDVNKANAVLQTNLDWMRLRITQLEKERAQLMYSISGIKVPTPEFVTETPDIGDILNAAPSFEDVGEKEAERLGISHQDDGTLVYKD